MTTTSNPASILDQYQTFFSKKMLAHRQNSLKLAGLPGVQHEADIERNHGNLTIRCFKKRPGASSNVAALTEGVAISTFAEIATGYVDATLAQIGEAAKVSDIVQLTAIFNWIDQFIETFGEDNALKMDDTIRDAIVSGMQDINSRFEIFCGVPPTLDGDDDFASLAALNPNNAKATALHFLGAATTIKKNLVPLIGGGLVAVVSPAVMHDLRQDKDWLSAATHSRPDQLYKMAEMTMHGIRFIEGTNPFQENVYGTNVSGGSVYSNFVFGRAAFGVPKLKGNGNPTRPKIIINNKPDKSDPLNQFCILGHSSYYTAKLMLTSLAGDVPNVVNVRAKSTYDNQA